MTVFASSFPVFMPLLSFSYLTRLANNHPKQRQIKRVSMGTLISVLTQMGIQLAFYHLGLCVHMGFPGVSVVKNLPAKAEDPGSIPGSGRPPGGGNGNSLQYLCLENPIDRGAWWATVHEVTKSQTQLSD